MNGNNIINGKVRFAVSEEKARPKWEQAILAKALDGGDYAPNALRFQCKIAKDANNTFELFTDASGRTFRLNPKAKSQFGRNFEGEPFLTVGVIADDGERYRLHWEGEHVPFWMQEVAVNHDEGKRIRATRKSLDLGAAKVWKLGQKQGKVSADSRPNHDRDKQGNPYPRAPRRNHSRLCRADLLKVMSTKGNR